MRPSLLFEVLVDDAELQSLGITSGRIKESQSIDSRPFADGYFVTINMEESTIANAAIARGPRNCTFAVHHSADIDRDYGPITDILNRIDRLVLSIEDDTGSDGVRVSVVRRGGRSGNLLDEGWNTITRTATYGVLYNEYAA